MELRKLAIIEQCFNRGMSPFECYDVLSEEFPASAIPILDVIREVYKELEEEYDRL